MKISIRKFESKDIPKKVEWINNSENNKYLHYDIPLKLKKLKNGLKTIKIEQIASTRLIEADGCSVWNNRVIVYRSKK